MSWYDALLFLNALSEREGFKPYYSLSEIDVRKGAVFQATVIVQGGPGYRLPTEAEWEYACRAGTAGAYSFGDSESTLDEFAVTGYLPSGMRAHQKGEKKPNPLGLFDMHGNVAEYCADAFSEDSYVNPQAADESIPATHRVIRGGSWFNGPLLARCSTRNGELAGTPRNYVGFRVARNVEALLSVK